MAAVRLLGRFLRGALPPAGPPPSGLSNATPQTAVPPFSPLGGLFKTREAAGLLRPGLLARFCFVSTSAATGVLAYQPRLCLQTTFYGHLLLRKPDNNVRSYTDTLLKDKNRPAGQFTR